MRSRCWHNACESDPVMPGAIGRARRERRRIFDVLFAFIARSIVAATFRAASRNSYSKTRAAIPVGLPPQRKTFWFAAQNSNRPATWMTLFKPVPPIVFA